MTFEFFAFQLTLHIGCPNGCQNCENDLCQCYIPDEDRNYLQCKQQIQLQFDQCVSKCDHDIICDVVCELDYQEGLKDCPCQENCPTGCPCPNYQCQQSSTSSTSGMMTPSTTPFYTTTAMSTTTTTFVEFETTTTITGTPVITTPETTTQPIGNLKNSILHLNSFINSTSYVRNDPATNGGELVKIWFVSLGVSI